MRFTRTAILLTLTTGLLLISADAQTRRRKTTAKKPAATATTPAVIAQPTPEPTPEQTVAPKRNERPGSTQAEKPSITPAASDPTYFYEFAQPEFVIAKIVIQHDDAGRGTITFTRKMFDETVTDPLEVSAATLERINAAYTALNFIDSRENYQYEKDYSHLGTATFRRKQAGKERTAQFNYTINKDAKTLMDEYRKLGQQYVWIFDITLARQNQPLESPRLVDALDGMLRRNDISDPEQLVPLLKSMTDDERIPLIARNHAGKLVERIQKSNGKR